MKHLAMSLWSLVRYFSPFPLLLCASFLSSFLPTTLSSARFFSPHHFLVSILSRCTITRVLFLSLFSLTQPLFLLSLRPQDMRIYVDELLPIVLHNFQDQHRSLPRQRLSFSPPSFIIKSLIVALPSSFTAPTRSLLPWEHWISFFRELDMSLIR